MIKIFGDKIDDQIFPKEIKRFTQEEKDLITNFVNLILREDKKSELDKIEISPQYDRLDNCTEIFVGKSYTFASRYDLGYSTSVISGIDTTRSYGNVKGTNKRFDELDTWSWTWGTVATADKTNLQTFENAIDITRLKFIYSEDATTGPFHWVSKTNAFVFTEVAFGYYRVSINMEEEIE